MKLWKNSLCFDSNPSPRFELIGSINRRKRDKNLQHDDLAVCKKSTRAVKLQSNVTPPSPFLWSRDCNLGFRWRSASLCVPGPGVWIWDLHRTRSAVGWEGRGGWTKRCLYQVGRWFLGGRGAGVRCIRDKKRGPCTVSGARTPSIEGEEGGRRILPVAFGYDRNENRKRGETTKYPLNSFHERR